MSNAVPAPPAIDRAAFGAAPSRYRQVSDRRLVLAAQRTDPRSHLSPQNIHLDPLTSAVSVALDSLARAENAAVGQRNSLPIFRY